MHITRQHILSKVSTFEILEHFLKEYYERENADFRPGVHVYVPEISGEQKTPSFNIYASRTSNEYRWKDWVGHDGSCFDLVMNLYGVNFPEALKIINKEMGLGLDSENVDYSKVKPKAEPKVKVEKDYTFTVTYDYWKQKYLKFWSHYGISKQTLEFFNIKPIKRLNYFGKGNAPKTIESRSGGLIYFIDRGEWGKLYLPNIEGVQKKGFIYVGKKESDYVFGYEQLPESGDDLYLVAGEKDCLSMYSHGMNAVCLNSEETPPKNSEKFMSLIKSKRFKNYWVMYDNDPTGRRQMMTISNEIPELRPKVLPIPDNWDISDYLRDKYKNQMY